jgi:hypothetical protein
LVVVVVVLVAVEVDGFSAAVATVDSEEDFL